ncbi:helix-turn-helix domain-containing protein [Sphingobium aquiterrae]|uniref:helix-turn-helix domain-containing protein n=1 Tax=Sphingobium aquiterrae TaxID=2038656 RepID=UPI003019CEB4
MRYFAPPESLRHAFGALYLFTADRTQFTDTTRADFGQLRFMLNGGGFYHFHDGRALPTPEVCLLGPTFGATRFVLDGPGCVIGVSLLPLGWLALDCGDASAMSDRLADKTGADPAYRALLTQLRGIDGVDQAVDAIWCFLKTQVPAPPPAIARFVAAVDDWLANENSPRIEMLAGVTDLSGRQRARLANRLYGAPPKLLARKYRALRCAAKIVVDKRPWAELCDEGTFYDQSHFIREIRHFIGLTPHQLMSDPTDVARLTLQRRDMGGAVAEINRIS